MKTNHTKVASLINQAIQACSYDEVLAPVRKHLKGVLAMVEKRGKRPLDTYKEKAVTLNQEWWQMLVKGLKKDQP